MGWMSELGPSVLKGCETSFEPTRLPVGRHTWQPNRQTPFKQAALMLVRVLWCKSQSWVGRTALKTARNTFWKIIRPVIFVHCFLFLTFSLIYVSFLFPFFRFYIFVFLSHILSFFTVVFYFFFLFLIFFFFIIFLLSFLTCPYITAIFIFCLF